MKTCGNCKYCMENNICNGDCLCKVKDIEVSKDDDINFYGKKITPPVNVTRKPKRRTRK